MATQAKITSVEAIELFRAALIVFTSQARPALEEISGEGTRTRVWLEHDQRRFWQNELRQRNKKLEQTQQELRHRSAVAISGIHFSPDDGRSSSATRRPRSRGETGPVEKMGRELENRSAPLLKEIEQLHSFLTAEMPKAVAYLTQVVRTLDAYAEAGRGTRRSGTGGEQAMSASGSKAGSPALPRNLRSNGRKPRITGVTKRARSLSASICRNCS